MPSPRPALTRTSPGRSHAMQPDDLQPRSDAGVASPEIVNTLQTDHRTLNLRPGSTPVPAGCAVSLHRPQPNTDYADDRHSTDQSNPRYGTHPPFGDERKRSAPSSRRSEIQGRANRPILGKKPRVSPPAFMRGCLRNACAPDEPRTAPHLPEAPRANVAASAFGGASIPNNNPLASVVMWQAGSWRDGLACRLSACATCDTIATGGEGAGMVATVGG